ncbi:MAG: carboxypeptidase, partial [Bacteroidota bacterium]|nr:carboxypeptidase [Bacteroidota bacterium]
MRLFTAFVLLACMASGINTNAQRRSTPPPADTPAPPAEKLPPGSRTLNVDSSVTTHAEVTVKGQRIPYDATAGTMPVWDQDGKPIAGVFYTYYERSDVKDRDARPLVISFNGGPGTPSVWMEIGYTGPRRLN